MISLEVILLLLRWCTGLRLLNLHLIDGRCYSGNKRRFSDTTNPKHELDRRSFPRSSSKNPHYQTACAPLANGQLLIVPFNRIESQGALPASA